MSPSVPHPDTLTRLCAGAVALSLAVGVIGCESLKPAPTAAQEAAAWTAWGEWWADLQPNEEPGDLQQEVDAAYAREFFRKNP